VTSIGFYNQLGQPLFLCRNDYSGTEFTELPSFGSVICRIPKLPLPAGTFTVNLQCEINGTVVEWIEGAYTLSVEAGDFYGSGRLPPSSRGDLLVEHDWLVMKSKPVKESSV
jgi:lipopolysaccharide transport system ATP-binding protein